MCVVDVSQPQYWTVVKNYWNEKYEGSSVVKKHNVRKKMIKKKKIFHYLLWVFCYSSLQARYVILINAFSLRHQFGD